MIVAELKIGDSFYFTQYPKSIFIYAGLYEKNGKVKAARCIPEGRLYAKYFNLNKEVNKLNY